MKMFVVEKRKTVGAFKTVSMNTSLKEAEEVFEKEKIDAGFNCGYEEKLEMTNAEKKKYPDVIKYAKVGGSHYNITIRIREVEVK